MTEKVVTVRINEDGKSVTLSPGTFTVDAGEDDTLRWEVRGVPEGSTVRVKFVGFVKAPEPPLKAPEAPLFEAGNVLEARSGVISGVIGVGAGEGLYTYVVELVDREGRATELERVSSDGKPMPKAGGVRPPGPGKNP